MFQDLNIWLIFVEALLLVGAAFFIARLLREKRKNDSHLSALELAANSVGTGLVFFDRHDRFVQSNDQARAFLPKLLENEKGAQDLQLSDFLNYFFDHAVDYDQSLANSLGRTARNREGLQFREVITVPDGRLCLAEVQKSTKGRAVLVLLDFGDVKDQEEEVLRLNQFNHELNQAIQAATSGIIITKPQAQGTHVTVFANKSFGEIVGLKPSDIVGRDMSDIFEKIEDKNVLKSILTIGSEEVEGTVELKIRDGGDVERLYDMKLTPVKDYAGNLELFIGLLSDTTALKTREAELAKAQKLEALGQLSAGVAHDFNNVLSIVDGYARLSASSVPDNPKVVEYLDRIQVAAQRGANLIKQMLTFSRHEIVEKNVINLSEVVKEQETFLLPLLDASVKFRVLVDNADMNIACPPDNITQILMNLVVNARDAMPQGGSLIVESRICPRDTLPAALQGKDEAIEYACLKVSDTGSGMEKDVIDRVFDPFFTTKDQGQGTGLGLSMVYGLVQQIGGYIDVDSTPGHGTAISIYLPLTDEEVDKKASGSLNDISSVRFDGFTALIAEDEPDLLELVANMLEKLGMNVLAAKDGHEALAIQDDFDGKIDLMLTDVVMPELNGVDLADLMAELRPETSVIFMSGYPSEGNKSSADIPEDAVFVAKPIQYNELVKLIYSRLNVSNDDAFSSEIQAPQWNKKNTQNGSKK